MSRIESKEDFELARERLRNRDSESLAEFLLSLAQDSGPVGAQVRTFILGDNIATAAELVRQRINRLAVPSEYEHRHALGREVGTHLDFIVDSIERLVLPGDPRAAFELLVAVFEADAVAVENCGEHDWGVVCAFERAAGVMAAAVALLPRGEVKRRIIVLVQADAYGMRGRLTSILREEHDANGDSIF